MGHRHVHVHNHFGWWWDLPSKIKCLPAFINLFPGDIFICKPTYIMRTNMRSWCRNCHFSFQSAFLLTWIILTPASISNDVPSEVWDEITYPFPNSNGWTVEVSEWKSNFNPQSMIYYYSMLGLKLYRISNRSPSRVVNSRQHRY